MIKLLNASSVNARSLETNHSTWNIYQFNLCSIAIVKLPFSVQSLHVQYIYISPVHGLCVVVSDYSEVMSDFILILQSHFTTTWQSPRIEAIYMLHNMIHVVADVLVSIWRQDICNHLDEANRLLRSALSHWGTQSECLTVIRHPEILTQKGIGQRHKSARPLTDKKSLNGIQ